MGSKRYYFYVKNPLLQEILDEFQRNKQLSDVISRMLVNGLEKEVKELARETEKRATHMKKTEKLYKKLAESKQNGEKELYEKYRQYRKDTGYDHKSAFNWIELKAKKTGSEPELLLKRFEKQLKEEEKT